MSQRKRVLVAMSGGVDSSVAAALLVDQGYEVIGATMNVWPPDGRPEGLRSCCSLASVEDARRVAAALSIPYYVLNYREIFERHVIRDFLSEYAGGRTPNPCIRCNQHLKFNAFLTRARQLSADFIATGHYARVQHDASSGRYVLGRGRDPGKDQSYSLYVMTQDQLAHTLLPLGQMTKDATRALAAELGLRVADKPDSQEICFVSDDDYAGFVERNLEHLPEPGPIRRRTGEVIGRHPGIHRYTVGQRKGLGLSQSTPLYVLEVDPEENALIVGEQSELWQNEAVVEAVNWIAFDDPPRELAVRAKIRYRSPEEPALVRPLSGGRAEVTFESPVRAISPGQAVVFYRGDTVVGGGVIVRPQPQVREPRASH